MKKIFSLLLLLCLVVTLTACGSDSSSSSSSSKKSKDSENTTSKDNKKEEKSNIKSITCSQTFSDSEGTFNFDFTFNYDEDQKEYIDGNASYLIEYASSISQEDFEEEYEEAQEECNRADYYTDCKVKKEDKKIILDTKVDLSKFDEYDLEKYDTLEKLKEFIEDDSANFSCTIK